MRTLQFAPILFILLYSCSAPKSVFTPQIRAAVERDSNAITRLQFYIDQDVELRREVSSASAKINAGKVIFENGKYINIIYLKKNTPGVAVNEYKNKIDVSFETDNGKALPFGVFNNPRWNEPYRIFADSWQNQYGKILYDGNTYYIQPYCAKAKLLIKKSEADKFEVNKRTMKGRRVS